MTHEAVRTPYWREMDRCEVSDSFTRPKRFMRGLVAYFAFCPAHGSLLPDLLGEAYQCSECKPGNLAEGRLVRVVFGANSKHLVDIAIERARQCCPSLYDDRKVYELD